MAPTSIGRVRRTPTVAGISGLAAIVAVVVAIAVAALGTGAWLIVARLAH
jgi:hypothetical protein